MKAECHGKVNPSHVGDQKLYRLDPPLKGWDDGEYEWVVSSAASPLGEPEVYLFPADKAGEISDWGELPGSKRGTLDHDEPLEDLGYAVVPA
jgi:hypothetical protein